MEEQVNNIAENLDLSNVENVPMDNNRIPDAWTIRDGRSGQTQVVSGYPTDSQILDFKRKLGYGTVKVTTDDAKTHVLEFTPVDLSALPKPLTSVVQFLEQKIST